MKTPSEIRRELIQEINASVTPAQIAATLRGCLAATTTGRNGTSQPDYRTRLAAVQILLDQVAGKPVQRVESASLEVTANLTADDLKERLRSSPAMLDAIRHTLDSIDV